MSKKKLSSADSANLTLLSHHLVNYLLSLPYVEIIIALTLSIKIATKYFHVVTSVAVLKAKKNACLVLIQNVLRRMNN